MVSISRLSTRTYIMSYPLLALDPVGSLGRVIFERCFLVSRKLIEANIALDKKIDEYSLAPDATKKQGIDRLKYDVTCLKVIKSQTDEAIRNLYKYTLPPAALCVSRKAPVGPGGKELTPVGSADRMKLN